MHARAFLQDGYTLLGYGLKWGKKQDVTKQCIRILHVRLCVLHHSPIQLHIFLSIGIEVLVVCDLFSARKQFKVCNICTYLHMLDMIYIILWLIMQNVFSKPVALYFMLELVWANY